MNGVLSNLWHGALDAISGVVIPDWGALIGLLPILLVVGLLGPILTLITLRWARYAVRSPHLPRRVGARAGRGAAAATRSEPPAGGAAAA